MPMKHRVSKVERERMIAEAAYFRAQQRGFEAGSSLDDWLTAEREIDTKIQVSPHDKKLGQLLEQLSDANEKLRHAVAKLRSEAGEEWNEEVERLHELRDRFAEKLDEIRGQTGQAKQRAKRQADKLWQDLTDALDRLRS
jgi:ABC-type transporter Mla subunit MlaD